jgi:hypothetical protein
MYRLVIYLFVIDKIGLNKEKGSLFSNFGKKKRIIIFDREVIYKNDLSIDFKML